jgi:hypothetical protein
VTADLCEYHSQVEGIFIRDVFEHNYDWQRILDNALASFTKKLCIVLFTPFADRTIEIAHNKAAGVDVPDLSLARNEIEGRLVGLKWLLLDNIKTNGGYGSEHIYFIWREESKPTPKRVIYTAVFGSYDALAPVSPPSGVDAICFTDDPAMKAEGWQMRVVEPDYPHPRTAAKTYKCMPHLYLPEYEQTLWVDGGFTIENPSFPDEALEYLNGSPMAMFAHPERDCLYQEAAYCKDWPKYADQNITGQVEHYRAMGHPEHWGLYAGGIIARCSNNPLVQLFGLLWFQENVRWTYQDQISLPYLLRKLDLLPTTFRQNLWDNNWGSWTNHTNRL